MSKKTLLQSLIKKQFSGCSSIQALIAGGNGIPFCFTWNNRQYFIKIIDPKRVEKKLEGQEEKALKKVKSKYVIKLLEEGYFKGTRYKYLLFPYIDGKDLSELITKKRKKGKKFTNKEIYKVALQVAKGIRDLWKQKVVHQDIKPQNVRVSKSLELMILDLGIARFKEDPRKAKGKGSFRYSSPQQIEAFIGEEPDVNFSDDHFALGTILYEMATSQYPYGRGESSDIRTVVPQPISKFNSDIDPNLERIITKLISKEPHNRYYTPKRLIAGLEKKDLRGDKILETPAVFYQQGPKSTGGYSYFFNKYSKGIKGSSVDTLSGVICSTSYPPSQSFVKDAKEQGYLIIIDPETHKLAYSESHFTTNFKQAPYVLKRLTHKDFFSSEFVRKWTKEVLDFQVKKKASIVISPYFFADSLEDNWYSITLNLLEESKKIFKKRSKKIPLFASLALTESFIRNKKARGRLLDKLMFEEFIRGVFLITEAERESSVPCYDREFITQLSSFIGILERRFSVILPFFDIAALFLVANGLSAFATNPSQSLRQVSIKKFKKEKKKIGGITRVHKVFIPALMNFLLYPKEVEDLVKRGLQKEISCPSPFCQKQYFNDPSIGWSKDDRANHYLFEVAKMIKEMGGLSKKERADWIKKKVKEAKNLYRKISSEGIPLHRHSNGKFLDEWEQIVP